MILFEWLVNIIPLVSNRFPDETSLSECNAKKHTGHVQQRPLITPDRARFGSLKCFWAAHFLLLLESWQLLPSVFFRLPDPVFQSPGDESIFQQLQQKICPGAFAMPCPTPRVEWASRSSCRLRDYRIIWRVGILKKGANQAKLYTLDCLIARLFFQNNL